MSPMEVDIGLRAWLLIFGSVFILAILIHGYWKMRSSRNPIKMQLDKSFASDRDPDSNNDDIGMLRAELPSGGARLADQGEQTSLLFGDADHFDSDAGDAPDLDQSVPVLMEAVELGDSSGQYAKENSSGASAATSGEEKIVVLYLIATEGTLNGQVLLESLVPCNLEYGEMGLFHLKTDTGHIKFSLASAVEPGSFELNSIKELETPGVILFMKAHEQAEPDIIFDEMLEVARSVAEEIGCQIRDETQSVVTPQTIEHYRQSIREFSHKYQ